MKIIKYMKIIDKIIVSPTPPTQTQNAAWFDGKEIKMEVKVGDKVICSKYAGTEVTLDKEEYVIVKQSDILAIVE